MTHGNRVEMQAWQTLAKRPLQLMNAVVPGSNPRLERAINWVERRIVALQEDPYRYSPEFNSALTKTYKRNISMAALAAILPPVFFSATHLIESGDISLHTITASALWAISAFTLTHFGARSTRKEMIAEHLETEQAQKEVRLKGEIMDLAGDAIFLHDEAGKFYYINEAAYKERGYTREELLGIRLSQLDVPKYAELIEPRIREFITKGAAKFETAHRRKDGSELPLEVHLSRIHWEGKDLILSVTRDLTERKRVEKALRESEDIFNSFMEHSPIYVFFKDGNIRALKLSRNYEAMLGRPTAQLLGKNMAELFPSEIAKIMVADDMRIIKEGKEIVIEEELNGRVYSTIKFPFHTEDGEGYLAGFTTDITERKRAEEEIQASIIRSMNLERQAAVGNMVGTLSHAMKNMLLELAGGLDLNGELHDKLNAIFEVRLASRQPAAPRNLELERQALAIMNEMAENSGHSKEALLDMEKMVRNMLSFSSIGTEGTRTIQVKAELLRTLQLMGRVAEQKKTTLDIDLRGLSGRDAVELPSNALQDIVRNLVANAIEAFEAREDERPRTIKITAGRDNDWINLVVEDNGPGIPSSLHAQLFNKAIASEKRGGTGIGLSTVKAMLDAAGGLAELYSEVGRGTKITVKLPRRDHEEVSVLLPKKIEPMMTREEAGKFTIMMIDDMPLVLNLTENRLLNLGFKVKAYLNADQALAAYRRLRKKPDLVLTDQSMPDTYGHELIAKMKNDPAAGRSRFAIFSGNLVPDDPQDPLRRAIDSGVHFIQKGADLDRFDQDVTGILRPSSGGPNKMAANGASVIRAERNNSTALFMGRVVHKLNNYLTGIQMPINLARVNAEKAGEERVPVPAVFKKCLVAIIAESRALEKFAASEGSQGELEDISQSHLPASLMNDPEFNEVWNKTPAGERAKLAVMAALYLNNGMADLCNKLEKYLAAETISLSEARQIEDAALAFQQQNNAAGLRGERKDLIAKYREYLRLLAIDP